MHVLLGVLLAQEVLIASIAHITYPFRSNGVENINPRNSNRWVEATTRRECEERVTRQMFRDQVAGNQGIPHHEYDG